MDRHSRWVQFLKVLLPLAAILMLSTVFLLSRSIETNVSVPFTQKEVDERLAGQVVTRPNYRGTTRKGEDVQIEAAQVTQGGQGDSPTAAEFTGRYGLLNGGVITLDSNDGQISPDKGTATFAGDVLITTTDGIQVRTDLLNTSLEEIRGNTPGQVNGTGPIGQFTAGRMTFGAEKNRRPGPYSFYRWREVGI